MFMAKIAFVSDVVYPWVKGGMETTHYFEMKELARNNEVYCFYMWFGGMICWNAHKGEEA